MPRYRKKPVEVEAMLFDGSTADTHTVYQWVERNTLGSFEPLDVIEGRKPYPASGVSIDPRDGRMIISTLEGLHWVDLGDYVIRGVKGEFYPCKPDIFAATYEPATPCKASSSAPNALGNECCTLPAGHTGRHADGNLTWPAREEDGQEKTARTLSSLYRFAEEDVTRIISLYEQWVKAGPPPLGTSVARWWDARLVELHDAIRPPSREQKERPTHPDGTPYRHHEMVAEGWEFCDGCRTWSTATAERRHQCPETHMRGPAAPEPTGDA